MCKDTTFSENAKKNLHFPQKWEQNRSTPKKGNEVTQYVRGLSSLHVMAIVSLHYHFHNLFTYLHYGNTAWL